MIQDVISSDISVAGEAQFTATTPGPISQPVTAPGALGLVFSNGGNDPWFAAGDNLRLQEVSVNIPHCFCQGDGLHTIQFKWRDQFDNLLPVPELSGFGFLNIPTLCTPLRFGASGGNEGLYIAVPNVAGEKQRLVLFAITLNVSQVNLPAVLSGQTIKVQYHLLVAHTKALDPLP